MVHLGVILSCYATVMQRLADISHALRRQGIWTPQLSFLSGSTNLARPRSECYRRRTSRAPLHRRCRVQLVGARSGHAIGNRFLRDAVTASRAVPTQLAKLSRMGRLLWTEWPDRAVDLRPVMGHMGARVP